MPDAEAIEKLRDRAEWAEAKIILLLDDCNILERAGQRMIHIDRVREIVGASLMPDAVEIDD